jgi:hypothetical protein
MNPDPWQWQKSETVRFILIGLPTLVLLLTWSRRTSRKGFLYRASWINLWSFAIWFLCMWSLPVVESHRALAWIVFSSIPLLFIYVWPFTFIIGSIVLCLLAFRAKGTDRLFVVLCGILMVILWASSLVPPNLACNQTKRHLEAKSSSMMES